MGQTPPPAGDLVGVPVDRGQKTENRKQIVMRASDFCPLSSDFCPLRQFCLKRLIIAKQPLARLFDEADGFVLFVLVIGAPVAGL